MFWNTKKKGHFLLLFYQKQTQIALWELEGVSCAAVLRETAPPPLPALHPGTLVRLGGGGHTSMLQLTGC